MFIVIGAKRSVCLCASKSNEIRTGCAAKKVKVYCRVASPKGTSELLIKGLALRRPLGHRLYKGRILSPGS